MIATRFEMERYMFSEDANIPYADILGNAATEFISSIPDGSEYSIADEAKKAQAMDEGPDIKSASEIIAEQRGMTKE